MPPIHHVEIERKYDVDDDVETPNLIGIGPIAATRGPATIDLVAVYFDSSELRLAAARIALRRRLGGADEGWHVKQPADEGRTELHWPLEPDRESMPAALAEWLHEQVGEIDVQPIARITNTRVVVELTDAAGFTIAELCDDHVTAEDLRRSVPSEWREWEVELQAAAPDSRAARTELLEQIETRLIEAGARPAASESKLAKALGLGAQ